MHDGNELQGASLESSFCRKSFGFLTEEKKLMNLKRSTKRELCHHKEKQKVFALEPIPGIFFFCEESMLLRG